MTLISTTGTRTTKSQNIKHKQKTETTMITSPKTLMAMALCAIICLSCNKDILDKDVEPTPTPTPTPTPKAKPVKFAISTKATSRTEYGPQDAEKNWPIYWTAGDNILVYSPDAYYDEEEGYEKQAIYQVLTNPVDSTLPATLDSLDKHIYWNPEVEQHQFYATYPGDGVAINDDGVATFPINFNQTCTIKAAASGNMFTAEPDMKQNAYMVAKTKKSYTETETQGVSLDFTPIMTTLDIVVKGPTESGKVVALTGLTVKFKLTNKVSVSDKVFKYDIKNRTMVNHGTNDEVSIFVGIKDATNDNQGFIDLEQNKSVKLPVMLPPNAIYEGHTAKIRVHAQAKDNTSAINRSVTVGSGTIDSPLVVASTKRQINLPSINPVSGAANAWMTPLDDDIYVSQLSMPGTHDAGTGKGTSLFNAGQTQDFSIADQMNIGIRAFDLRPAYRYYQPWIGTKYDEFWIYHGVTSTDYSLKAAFNEIVAYLEANPKEFAIVIMRHEDETPSTGKNPDKFAPNMKTFLDGYSAYTIPFKKDLTVGDCRKKIIVLSRNTYDNGPVGGYITGFPNNCSSLDEGNSAASIYNGNNTAVLQVNDYYSFSVQNEKLNRIKAMMDWAATHHTDPALVNEWVINHCSGYNTLIGISTTNGYRKNAEDSNKFAFDYLTGTAKIGTTSYTKPVGSTGIVMMDFAGTRRSGSGTLIAPYYQVYGDLLPQAIIDNNYKFPMKKKTTN